MARPKKLKKGTSIPFSIIDLQELYMGCDIHLYSETRRDGTWTCDQSDQVERTEEDFGNGLEPYIHISDMGNLSGRDYWLFGMLNNGVRTNWDWAWPYRDLFPEDASALLTEQKTQEGEDAHSASFFTRAELKAKVIELRLKRAEYLINPPVNTQWAEAVPYHSDKLEGLISSLDADVPDEDQRIVFWFDN